MSNVLKRKHQRLLLVLLALGALIGSGLLASWALRNQASYFYVPSEMLAAPPPQDTAVRLGGMVKQGSLIRLPDGITIEFVVADGEGSIPVRFSGIAPDLFVEGSGVVAEGQLNSNGTFIAHNLLAKHDENYVPRELKDMTDAQKQRAVSETSK